MTATPEDLALLHSKEHICSVKDGSFTDGDTPAYPGISDIALISAAGALSAAASAMSGAPAFSLMRPPGHHAGKERVAGFCYFNNIALACAKLVAEKKAARVAILDIDVHHGDGTESLVLGRGEIRFTSLHQFPLYPGTGAESRGNCENITLEAGTDEDAYMKRLEPALERLLAFKPAVLAVSAGFDTYKDDPLAGLKLGVKTYARIGRLMAATKLPRFAVLEGGYAEELPLLIESFLDGFFQ